jgi:hypothetical protein
MKRTLGDIRPVISKLLSMASTDSRVVGYINEAQERLLYKGKWVDSYARYAVANSNGTITWPRQLETIESVAIDGVPSVIRNSWFEFLSSGPGLADSTGADNLTLLDRGTACTFSDIDTDAPDKRLRLYYNSADDAKTVTIQGYDDAGAWIRTTSGTARIDGEILTLGGGTEVADTSVTGFTHRIDTINKFSLISAVQKDSTAYSMWVYEIETTGTASEIDLSKRLIAEYDPTETRPVYRRSLIAGLPDESTQTVTVVGKLRFIPVVNDSDWLIIGYESALKEMVLSIRKAENNLVDEAAAYEARAVVLLEEQLSHYLGDGQVQVLRLQNASTWGGGVPNLQ